uniref:Uncharacterized protein n=1 Tax=Spongospora subterranea TaxID=70186 RepID=A0A0H5R1K5_9EUKA|eukprot:CRZ01694.1 hypothetical protein [Spongospora subterranea]
MQMELLATMRIDTRIVDTDFFVFNNCLIFQVESDRELFPKQIEEKSAMLTQELEHLKQRFTVEQTVREHREKQLTNQIRDDKDNVLQQFRAVRFGIDQRWRDLDMEISSETKQRRAEAELLQTQTSEKLLLLSSELELCQRERVRTTREVAKAVVHYAAALRDGVNIVSEAAGL